MNLKITHNSVSKCRQNGSAMMEVVTALFLLAIGLLGTLAIQVKGVNSNQRAQFATDANLLAQDMASRIMGYVRNVDVANQVDASVLDDFNGINTKTSTATMPTCLATGCAAQDQIIFDEWQWSSNIRTRLPDGIGKVAYSAGVYTITVMWNHDQIASPTTNCSGSGTDLACFVYALRVD